MTATHQVVTLTPTKAGKPLLKRQLAKQTKLQHLYNILCEAACAGKPCPTNSMLADMLDYSAPSKASDAVSLLEAMGFITADRGRTNRVVTIVKTGHRTAGATSRRPGQWTEDQDAILMDGIAEGVGFTAVGKLVGKTKSACISRFHKLAAALGPQAS